MPEPTFLRAVLVDYLQRSASFEVVCAVWKRSFYYSYHALLDAGLKDAKCTPENIERLYQLLQSIEGEEADSPVPGVSEKAQGK